MPDEGSSDPAFPLKIEGIVQLIARDAQFSGERLRVGQSSPPVQIRSKCAHNQLYNSKHAQ